MHILTDDEKPQIERASTSPPLRRARIRRILTIGAISVFFTSAGFLIATAPAIASIIALVSAPSDAESVSLFKTTDEIAAGINEHINNHPLSIALRSNPAWAESRPHLRYPEAHKKHSLTAGTLLGPGRFAVPPVVFCDDKQLVSISYVGTDMCGHVGIIHGGLLATMLDEGLARCAFNSLPNKIGVTARLTVNYRKPARAGSYLLLRAETTKVEGRKVWVTGRIEMLGEDEKPGEVLVEAEGLNPSIDHPSLYLRYSRPRPDECEAAKYTCPDFSTGLGARLTPSAIHIARPRGPTTTRYPALARGVILRSYQLRDYHIARTRIKQDVGARNKFQRVITPNQFRQRRDASATVSDRPQMETMQTDGILSRTALYDLHVEKGGKMVPFAGYSMPVQYSDLSVSESHQWTRERASLFDVGHMVQHHVSGPGAAAFLEMITPTSTPHLQQNHSTLSCLLHPFTGGIVDDTVITRLGPELFYLVTNAACKNKDLQYFKEQLQKRDTRLGDVEWEVRNGWGLVALQGPLSADVLESALQMSGIEGIGLKSLYFGQCATIDAKAPGIAPESVEGTILISRGGYTGEDGFEISLPPPITAKFTKLLLQAGRAERLRLAGLGARDSLRLEAGMCLYGHDLDDNTTPVEAGLSWVVHKDRRAAGGFNGHETILRQLKPAKEGGGVKRRRIGLIVEGAPAREGAEIVGPDDEIVGKVTSGCPSPTLGQNIAMGYVKSGSHKTGTELGVLVRGKRRKAEVVRMPFVASMPSESEKNPDAGLEEFQFPNLGEVALHGLKAKIQDTLKQTNHSPSKTKTERSKQERQVERNKKSEKVPKEVAVKPQDVGSSPFRNSQGNDWRKPNQKPATVTLQKHSKKRLRNGEPIKQTLDQDAADCSGPGHNQPNGKRATSFDIRQEIKALGGSEDDYALVAGIQSESEVEGKDAVDGKRSDSRLGRDLKKFVQGLEIDKMKHEIMVEPSDAGEDAEEEDIHEDQEDAVRSSHDVSGLRAVGNAASTITSARSANNRQSQLVFQPLAEWHAAELPSLPTSSGDQRALPLVLTDRLHEHAKTLLEKENQAYKDTGRSVSSAHKFYSTIISSGTLSDKIGALTLSVQESPLHNMKALESLINLAGKRSRAQAVEVLGALKDLFGPGNLLPSNRKLRSFADQLASTTLFKANGLQWTRDKPLPRPMNESHLVSWAYEDWLKSAFFQVLKVIETWCNDEVVFARGKAVDYACSLLMEKPEQEANLLRLLVNKLGDSDKKIASRTSFHILQLETTHPSMKSIIISAIESDLLFRPGQSLQAKYYATITLNQTVLSSREEGVAKKLLDIYFALFLQLLEKPDKAKMKVTGANRTNSVRINRKGEVQGGGGAGGKKAREKQAKKAKYTAADEDLREKVLSALLTGINRAIPFTNTAEESFEKHLDTLFRVTHSSNFNTSIQALMLIQHIQGSNQSSVDRFYRTLYESLLDPRLLTSSKQVLYLNLLFRALRSDLNLKRTKAFAKRLLQVVAMHQPSFTCGVIYLLRVLEDVFPSLQTYVHQPEKDPSNDEEVFRDVGEDAVDPFPSSTQPKSATSFEVYDGRKRDPLYANASNSTLWELQPLLSHYHPSVSLFATRLLTHAPMPPKPDLGLNTLIHFLDRFVYKNPKSYAARSISKGVSIMQPLAGGDKSSVLVSAASVKAGREKPMNSEAFWKQGSDNVGADELFFHRYFSVLGRDKEKRAEKKAKQSAKRRGERYGESGSDGDEDEIWKALVKSRAEIDGEGGDEDEEGFSDMESLEDDDYYDDDDDDEGDDYAKDDKAGEEMPELNDSEDDALLPSDDELRSEPDELFEAPLQTKKKRKIDSPITASGSKRGKERRRLKSLPTFASVEDYERMLGGDEEEGIA
ncbi:MAG: hypothetical protein Q9217_003647 [Psora testacea]